MIQLTIDRILPIVPIEDIYVSTIESYRQLVEEQLPLLPKENILCEPVSRNTAPSIGLGAAYIQHQYGDALMIVLPSDHLIKDHEAFTQAVEQACPIAEKDHNLVTLGILPNYPETCYNYIKIDESHKKDCTYKMYRFLGKPGLQEAVDYYTEDGYYWYSRMFVWKTSSILENMHQFQLRTYDAITKIQAALGTSKQKQTIQDVFPNIRSESIDSTIMRKSSDIYVLPCHFDWNDVGTWLSIERINGTDKNKNSISGNVVTVDTKYCTIESTDKLMAVVGMENVIIVDTPDATLVCSKKDTDQIRTVLEKLRLQGKEEYL